MYKKLAIGLILGVLACLVLIILSFFVFIGPYDPIKFVSSNIIIDNKGGGGELKIIDPNSLEIVVDYRLDERCSFGRMALSHIDNDQDALILIGDEYIHQYRWDKRTKTIYQLDEWSERYRNRHEGTFPGTGPSIFNDTTYFTDNTFPVFLSGTSYTLFSKKINSNEPFFKKSLTPEGQPGFMFWSIVISPLTSDIIVWDSANKNVQIRDSYDLTLKHKFEAIQGDCISVAADRGHVYFTDYNHGPPDWSKWLSTVTAMKDKNWDKMKRFFIVANVSNGEILHNITLTTGQNIKPSVIVPGGQNNVYVGTANGLINIYV